jgi:hypothetical protein
MKFLIAPVLALIIFSTALTSCRKNHYKVNVSTIKADIGIKRLETDMFSLNPDEIPASIPMLREKYRGFLQLFSYVINTGDVNDPSFGDFLVRFCTDKQNNDVYDLTMKVYPDVDKIEEDLEQAFRHFLHYFPEREIPGVFTCISGFNNSIIIGDSILGISLDRYLGADCEYYPRLEIYNYLAARMTPEYIVPDCMYAWAASEWDIASVNYPSDNVITGMIHQGKLRYFEKSMLPDLSDELIFGFTTEQVNFCRKNEGQMWQYLIENDLLFNTDQFIIRKLLGEAPFTSYFSKESPGRAAAWLGFRIVESYMMKNPGTGMEKLMNMADVQEILEKARYNPQ